MIAQFRAHSPIPGYAACRARLGLTVVALTSSTDSDTAAQLLAQVVAEAINAGDGYAARDVLGFRNATSGVTERPSEALSRLGSGTLPEPLLESIIGSTTMAKNT